MIAIHCQHKTQKNARGRNCQTCLIILRTRGESGLNGATADARKDGWSTAKG